MTNQPPRARRKQLPEGKLLALDFGSRRTGVAVADELGLFAHPRPAIVGLSGQRLVERVVALVAEEGVAGVIVGIPVTMSGGESAQTAEVREFVANLRTALDIPVIEADERLTSVQAGAMLSGRERKRSGQRDSAAAALVLQSVLDTRREIAR